MEFRNLHRQYNVLEEKISTAIFEVLSNDKLILGEQVTAVENALAEYVGTRFCVSCANGTDALTLALMSWGIGRGDAVFIPNFTFFSTGEVIAQVGATPVFVDVEADTFNIDVESLENAIININKEGLLKPSVVIPVDLFGLPADYTRIEKIAKKYNIRILEDGAQGFGGRIKHLERRACSYGDISTTSFFPAKPLGCYGDGGAIFTDDQKSAELLRSLRVHGKGEDKYDNIRIGLNSRLDTIQAAILLVKLAAFKSFELEEVNKKADRYSSLIEVLNNKFGQELIKMPIIKKDFYSSWAQYTIILDDKIDRDTLQHYLQKHGVPSMIYYRKTLHKQKAFEGMGRSFDDLSTSNYLSRQVLSLPICPYITENEQEHVIKSLEEYFIKNFKS